MSAAVEQLCDRLRDWLNAIEGRLRTFKANIRDLSEKAEAARCGLNDRVHRIIRRHSEKMEQRKKHHPHPLSK